MKLRTFGGVAALVCGVILLSTVHAGENEQRFKIMTVDDQGGEPVVFQFTTEHSLADLADGESRVITGSDGETVTVSRAGSELTILTSEGREIQIPFVGDQHVHVAHTSGDTVHKEVRVIRRDSSASASDVMVVAPGGLSDAEKQVLRDALAAAGSDKKLHFVGDGMHSEVEIEIESSD